MRNTKRVHTNKNKAGARVLHKIKRRTREEVGAPHPPAPVRRIIMSECVYVQKIKSTYM
jgi:hypothetical protein